MKLIRCKVMGEVDSTKCYNCYSNHLSGESFPSRVLCKSSNVEEELSMEDNEPVLELENVA